MLIEKRSFINGTDGDTSQRLLPDDVMLNLMNGRCSVSQFGRNYRIENTPGTTLISQQVYPPYGVSQTIGSTIDTARRRIVYFNWNSFGDHGIYAYDLTNGVTYAILYDSQVIGGLNFSKSFRIDRNAKVIGDLLYWTDNNNEPRRINIEAAIKMNQASYVTTVAPYSWPMNQSVINLLRRPYGLSVIATKITAGGFANKFIADFGGQFACRLIYRDGEYSVISVPSDIVNYNFSTDTFNEIQVVFPLAEVFDQDVQIIQLVVRYDNTPDYFIIKEWNKANATDLAAINSHNNGITNLTYNFFDNTTGQPVGQDDSLKPFDPVPLTTKTLEIAVNRLFLSNNLKGYNTPTTTSLSGSLSAYGIDPSVALALKCNSSYQIGVRFRDGGKRESFVVTNANCIVTNTDRTFSSIPYNSLAWVLSNAAATIEIPSWAVYYDILITKNLRTHFFKEMSTSNIQYAIRNSNGTYTYQTTYTNTPYAIAVDISFMTSLGIGYVADLGDLCRLYLGNTATVYEQPVIGQDGSYILVAPANIGSVNPQPGCFFEFYTPYKPLDNETFYTTGQSYKITNPGTNSRQYSTTSGIITGDVYRTNTLVGHYEIMSPNINKIDDWIQFYGESNNKSTLGQVAKNNFIQWSNVKITGAQTNGLSTFEALNEKSVPAELGGINKIQLTNKISDSGQGNIMLAICDEETASMYLGEVQVLGASGTAYVAESANVIGTVNVLNGSSGTRNPESVISYLGLVFWLDTINGAVAQYSPEGLEFVSRYKQSRFFKNYCKDYLSANSNNLDNINGFHHIPTCVDPFYKEIVFELPGLIYENYANVLPSYSSVPSYLTSIINRFDIYDQLAKSMCFRFEENYWGNNMNYGAEWYENIDNQMFGFKNGFLWSFNTNTINWNTFFGVQQPMRVCFTGNLNPSMLKVLNNISVESSIAPTGTVVLTAIPNQQISDLQQSDYTNQQGIYYATFYMDRLSPNSSIGGTADQKLFTGDPLTDFSIFVMLEFPEYTGLQWIQFADIGYSVSRGQKQVINPVNS